MTVAEGMAEDGRSSRKVYEGGDIGIIDLKRKVFSAKDMFLEIILFLFECQGIGTHDVGVGVLGRYMGWGGLGWSL